MNRGKTNTYFFLSPSSNTEEDVFRELLLRQAGRPCIFHKNMWIIYVIKSVGGNGHVMLFCIKLCWPCAPDIWGNGNMLTFETHGKISDYRLGAPRHVTWQNQLLDLSYLALAKECRRLFNNFTFLHKCSRDMNTLHTSSKISTVKKCAFGREKRWTYVETSWKCELMPMHFHRFGWFSKVTCDMDDIWTWMFHRHLSRIQIFNWVCS